jgi:hypothetical protein
MTRSVKFLAPEDRYWAVGSNPAWKAHRVVGDWAGPGCKETACGSSIWLHAETFGSNWPFPSGGMSFDFDEIPSEYVICLKCVNADETVD